MSTRTVSCIACFVGLLSLFNVVGFQALNKTCGLNKYNIGLGLFWVPALIVGAIVLGLTGRLLAAPRRAQEKTGTQLGIVLGFVSLFAVAAGPTMMVVRWKVGVIDALLGWAFPLTAAAVAAVAGVLRKQLRWHALALLGAVSVASALFGARVGPFRTCDGGMLPFLMDLWPVFIAATIAEALTQTKTNRNY